MNKEFITIDGNEAAALVAFKVNEVVALYPITPSSPMMIPVLGSPSAV